MTKCWPWSLKISCFIQKWLAKITRPSLYILLIGFRWMNHIDAFIWALLSIVVLIILYLASNELVNRPIAVVILTILVLFQFLAFAPEFSKISCLGSFLAVFLGKRECSNVGTPIDDQKRNSASIFGPISLLKGNKYILSAENTEIDADSYKIVKGAKFVRQRYQMFSQKCHIYRQNIWFLKFCISEKDILESSVSSPYVEEVSNPAGDSPHLDAPLWISSEFLQPLSNSKIP